MAESRNLREAEAVSSPLEAQDAAPSCEAVHASSNAQASPASSPTSSQKPEMKIPEVADIVLQRLARQVEYYFSTSNLSKDTYVSTLRSLNDGYVPVSIIANFGKVKSLVPYDAMNAVRRAAADRSDLLEVVQIDPQTGKRVPAGVEAPLNAIEAVGPVSGEPIPVAQIPAAPVTPPVVKQVASIQNTVILRDVPSGTEESHVRALFTFEKCPEIQSLHLDVANCWFVTLNTESRDDMVNVMFALRTMKFASGEPVKARLKSGVVMNSDAPAFVPAMDQTMMYAPQQPSSPSRTNNGNGSRKNKKKKNGAKSRTNANNNNNSNNNQNKNAKGKTNNNNGNRKNNGGKQKKTNGSDKASQQKQEGRSSQNTSSEKASSQQAPPPSLGEEQFPALPTDDSVANSTKIEVEKVPEPRPEDDSYDELEKNRAHSDTASTATTSSSSSSSKQSPPQQPMGGYAAALLKAAAPKPVAPPAKKAEKAQSAKKATEAPKSKQIKAEAPKAVEASPPVSIQPPSWGGGKSFADVLRKEAAAAVAAAPEQSA